MHILINELQVSDPVTLASPHQTPTTPWENRYMTYYSYIRKSAILFARNANDRT